MKISTPLLIISIIIVLITLNVYVIPQQRKVQLQLDKKAIWKVPTPIDYDRIITPYSLIELVDTEPMFQLKSIDKKTGKAIKLKEFSEEIGTAHKVVCIKEALYVIFAGSSIYKLDAKTLEVLWKTDWALGSYSFEAISIEQAKDLILISYSNYYLNFYTFLKEETGAFYYEEKASKDSITTYFIPDIFKPKDSSNWSRYYNFKAHKLVFDNISKDVRFIKDYYLIDISDSLHLKAFDYDSHSYYKKNYQRSGSTLPFNTRKKALFLAHEIKESYNKEIANIQTSIQSIVFRFENTENSSYKKSKADYVFLEKEGPYPKLSILNIASSPQPAISDDYFVALNSYSYSHDYQEILLIDLNDLSKKQTFYIPTGQTVEQLLCDNERLYALVRESYAESYWLAVPFVF